MVTLGLHVGDAEAEELFYLNTRSMPVPTVRHAGFCGLTADTLILMCAIYPVTRRSVRKRERLIPPRNFYTISPTQLNSQTVANLKSKPRPYSGTGYKGIVNRKNRFYVRVWTIDHPHKKYVGGRFNCPIEAARYYDKYMRENVGDWVYLNFRE